MNNTPINDNLTSRIIPGLTSEYQIVSLPYWAWYWLDDFMQQHRISYQGILDTFGHTRDDINQTLHDIAELHQEYAMREVYNLVNDNEIDHKDYLKFKNASKRNDNKTPMNLPKIYKLFGFMPCATTLEAVWERRHYHDHK